MEDILLINSLTKSININNKPKQKDKDNQKIIYLSNKDFFGGTYRIKESGYYKLTEHIIFHPNPQYNFVPSPSQIENNIYPVKQGPYILGFFAAITVECSNVVIDLSNFSIRQSKEFYLRQRFFNIIELGSSPFIPKEGPGNFGNNYIGTTNCIIKNGNLNLTSHNGIHGNMCKNIVIHDLKINNFEVGGIAINDGDKIKIYNIIIENSLGTYLKVPINGRFSSAIFLSQQLNKISNSDNFNIQCGKNQIYLKDIVVKLDSLIKTTISEFLKTPQNQVPRFSEDVFQLFGNPNGFPDGSIIYGIVINRKGIAINELGCCDPVFEEDYSENVSLSNIVIRNLVVEPREVVGLLTKDKKIEKDFSGNLILVTKDIWFRSNNSFTDTKPFLNKFNKYDLILMSQVMLYEYAIKKNKKYMGVAKIDKSILEYVRFGNKSLKEINSNFYTFRNTDIMAHVMKGAIGIRIDYTNNLKASNIKINNIVNYGKMGFYNEYLKEYRDGLTGDDKNHLGHPKSDSTEIGYTGNFVRGISIVNSNNLDLNNIDISNVSSLNGKVYGINILKECTKIILNGIYMNNLNSCTNIKTSYQCQSTGIKSITNKDQIVLNNININIINPQQKIVYS